MKNKRLLNKLAIMSMAGCVIGLPLTVGAVGETKADTKKAKEMTYKTVNQLTSALAKGMGIVQKIQSGNFDLKDGIDLIHSLGKSYRWAFGNLPADVMGPWRGVATEIEHASTFEIKKERTWGDYAKSWVSPSAWAKSIKSWWTGKKDVPPPPKMKHGALTIWPREGFFESVASTLGSRKKSYWKLEPFGGSKIERSEGPLGITIGADDNGRKEVVQFVLFENNGNVAATISVAYSLFKKSNDIAISESSAAPSGINVNKEGPLKDLVAVRFKKSSSALKPDVLEGMSPKEVKDIKN